MPVPAHVLNDSSVAGPLGSLALSLVSPSASMMALRAVKWHQGLERLGVTLPFFLVHDVGMLFASARDHYEVGPRADMSVIAPRMREADRLLGGQKRLIDELLLCEAVRRAPELKMTDDLVIVVLSRLLGSVAARVASSPPYRSAVPVDASLFDGIDGQLPQLFSAVRRDFEARTLDALDAARLFVLTMADALDLDTLRLFGMLGNEASAGAMAQVDMLAALESPEANDIVNFSLEILPSVLETKTRPAAGSTAAYGYSGIGTRGSIDSLVLTELAWDDLELARRLMDNEVLYYAREQSKDEQKRIHYLLIDASASMRGDRQTFARGMAIATGKKLLLEGEEVAFRFFDSRLYELQRTRNGSIPTGYLLSFKGERGRNPARVFAELATDLDLLRRRDARSPVVHLFTHAALYIPREMVQAVRAHAQIAGVFILPSGGKKLDLDYLDLLNAHWVVDHATLGSGSARADAAKTILGESGQTTHGDSAPVSLRGGPASARSGPASARRGSVRPPPGDAQ